MGAARTREHSHGISQRIGWNRSAHCSGFKTGGRVSQTRLTLIFRRRRVAPAEKYLTAYDHVSALILGQESASTAEIVKATGLSRSAVTKAINSLIDEGVVEPTEPTRSPKQRYRRAQPTG